MSVTRCVLCQVVHPKFYNSEANLSSKVLSKLCCVEEQSINQYLPFILSIDVVGEPRDGTYSSLAFTSEVQICACPYS